MRTTENKQPKICIDAAGQSYQVELSSLTAFIEQVKDLTINSVNDIEYYLTLTRRFILLGAKQNHGVSELPDLLLFIDELNFLFKELYKKEVPNA